MLRIMLCAFFLLHPAVRPHNAGKTADADLLDAAAVQADYQEDKKATILSTSHQTIEMMEALYDSRDSNLRRKKSRTLFARRGFQERHRIQAPKPKLAPAPAPERCSRVTESCGPHLYCCDPCATCRCHFFNSICYCWRLSQHCIKKG